MNTEIPEENLPVPTAKPRKKREMTPELLEKLKLARERATELRNAARETKSKLPDNIPEKEKTKVAAYLTTRKAIKEKIKQEIVEELEQTPIKKSVPSTEHEVDSKGYMLPKGSTEPPPPLPTAPVEIPKKKTVKSVSVEPESDSDDEYTTIKVPKKKIIKWKDFAEKKPEPAPTPVVKKPVTNYHTQHLINLAMGGYKF
jgi:hypothetical protein